VWANGGQHGATGGVDGFDAGFAANAATAAGVEVTLQPGQIECGRGRQFGSHYVFALLFFLHVGAVDHPLQIVTLAD
jgi:hypothetical protein